MQYSRVACLDVYYYENYAKACCIVFENSPEEKIISEYDEIVDTICEYIPGEFYKRELPCLLEVIEKVQEGIRLIIVDSFVWLGKGKKGLGVYLFEALEQKIPVIGVAKTYFKDCSDYLEVYRGKSNKPLYVSSIGIDLYDSAKIVKNLKGDHRIPEILKKVDQLTRMI